MLKINKRFLFSWTAIFSATMILMASPAHAYLDAGTGSMVLQLIVGGVAGLLMAVKLYWRKILVTLGIKKELPEEPSAVDSDPD